MTPISDKQHLQADLLLVLTTLIAAAGWIFSKEALAGFAPLLFIALRFSGAGLVLALLCLTPLRGLSRAQFISALQVGVLFGAAMVFWILGLEFAQHLGVGAFLTSLGIVLVPLLNLLMGGEKPGRLVYLSLPFVLAGLAFLSLDSEFHLGFGELCFLLSACFLALMFIQNSRAATRIPALPLTAIQLLVTGGITGLCSLVFEDWSFQFPAAIWGWFLASMLLATSLRFLLQTYAQGLAPPSHSAIIMTLEPVWTAMLASYWFSETMSLFQLIGCSLIFTAVLVNRAPALRQWLRRGG
ncbi:DMT family transporter [Marinospirillum alkaliphilum]|uniref:Threonine/homoserine efflux transporter RhtA n=1 Tax=Marinospirillum alkaliphilum DSM 21637 TaxID=1122209 RepID=A0A1K1TC85_9GAMM|nr:DMT family transporter [Marinospirillum alkaliphilum]SFW98182.1 Threonine/homoserine efflux transporter RhtA [Marinospirillum alkaliphilum DSM 21637]